MLQFIIDNIIGSKNQRELSKMKPLISAIGNLEPLMKKLSDPALQGQTAEFRTRIDQGASVEDILPEAFAVVRETARRRLHMRHYDVQLIGGIALHRGTIAEMKTGEGKTLAATLPLYLNALVGKGCHLITVNDYLATRDAEWMSHIYRFLKLSVGVIFHSMPDSERQAAYQADITYGQNNEFGFDYLRDNMKESIEQYVQRPLNFAIVDEVDSILIDEARTPLIISGPAEQGADLYDRVNRIIPSLRQDVDYTLDEKANSSMLTDSGVESVEKMLNISNLYDPQNIHWLHHVQQSLAAHTLYKRNHHYLVRDGRVLIIDEHTGREMEGRRWSDGLHQAIEAKERVPIEEENQTLATITFQNYFRMYEKLAGMTGTAATEAEEFFKIYKLDVLVIPTNMPTVRADHQDLVYATEAGKFRHVIEELVDCNRRGQPVLVGTTSVEKSELLSKMLRRKNIKHSVLNAKHHTHEAQIVAQAGRKGAVTISTNMAGRGTDIILGGNPEVMAKEAHDPAENPDEFQLELQRLQKRCSREREEVLAAGGLHILGTERHESRRIDNQLRGRSGRQGDPGSSRFYLSLEDDLLRIFGSERIEGLMGRLGMSDDEPIEHRFVTKAIGNAQKKIEGHNFDIRKHLLEYDDVLNQQRQAIYSLRRDVLAGRHASSDKHSREDISSPAKDLSAGSDASPAFDQEIDDQIRAEIRQIGEKHLSILEQKEPSEEPAKNRLLSAHQGISRDLYRHFGAMVAIDGEDESADRILATAFAQVRASLDEQHERVCDAADRIIGNLIARFCHSAVHPENWDLTTVEEHLLKIFDVQLDLSSVELSQEVLAEHCYEQVEKQIESKESQLGRALFLYFARTFLLEEIDTQWMAHLRDMDHLREGIGLRGYGQRDPKQEYKQEGYDMFLAMMERIVERASEKLFKVQFLPEATYPPEKRSPGRKRTLSLGRGLLESHGRSQNDEERKVAKTFRRERPKIGRNDPCWCGSKKKYKRCHIWSDQESGTLEG